jgi:hypothetical protein
MAVLEPATFASLREAIRPSAREMRWTEIPWVTDLWEGRRLSRREGRPIFLWAMNGNPLGCV